MSEPTEDKFEFEEEFQTTVVAMICRDADFNIRTNGLIKPEYFANEIEAGIAALFLEYFDKYKSCPASKGVVAELIKAGVKRRLFRKEMIPDIMPKFAELNGIKVSDRDFVINQIETFARHQAIKAAILDSVELVGKGKFDEVERKIKEANEVGAGERLEGYDFYERTTERTTTRSDTLSGKIRPTGIPTGIPALDDLLKHKGWGREELSVYMGGPKSGKTTALIDAGLCASQAGYKVIYASLEVGVNIIADRADANLSEIHLSALAANLTEVEARVMAKKAAAGCFLVHGFPTGTLQPKALARLLSRYKSQGQEFDLVIVDYADLMAPNFRTNNPIENSKSIYVDLRAIAQTEKLAVLTATQTNREGMQQAVSRMEHVSDDINKVRIADLIISINADENEKKAREARLYLAASRNQQDGITIRVRQALERAKFVTGVLSVES